MSAIVVVTGTSIERGEAVVSRDTAPTARPTTIKVENAVLRFIEPLLVFARVQTMTFARLQIGDPRSARGHSSNI
jgi:hypothetical protein